MVLADSLQSNMYEHRPCYEPAAFAALVRGGAITQEEAESVVEMTEAQRDFLIKEGYAAAAVVDKLFRRRRETLELLRRYRSEKSAGHVFA